MVILNNMSIDDFQHDSSLLPKPLNIEEVVNYDDVSIDDFQHASSLLPKPLNIEEVVNYDDVFISGFQHDSSLLPKPLNIEEVVNYDDVSISGFQHASSLLGDNVLDDNILGEDEVVDEVVVVEKVVKVGEVVDENGNINCPDCRESTNCKDCVNCQLSDGLVDCQKCWYSTNCEGCVNCHFCDDCKYADGIIGGKDIGLYKFSSSGVLSMLGDLDEDVLNWIEKYLIQHPRHEQMLPLLDNTKKRLAYLVTNIDWVKEMIKNGLPEELFPDTILMRIISKSE